MSFDEQPDGDPHGECAAEIHRLQELLRELVACEDLKDHLDAAPENQDDYEREIDRLNREDYERRKIIAWSAARAYLGAGR